MGGDTSRGNYPDEICSDCGEKGCTFKHWGPLVPEGETGVFCTFCWNEREDAHEKGEPAKPLGVKPPGVPEVFKDKTINVTTQSGSVYHFGEPNEKVERTVSCNRRALDFSKCKIICLVHGKNLWLRPIDSSDPELHMWRTSAVVSIEVRVAAI